MGLDQKRREAVVLGPEIDAAAAVAPAAAVGGHEHGGDG